MGTFDFERLGRYRPQETVMKLLYLDALAGSPKPEDSQNGMIDLFDRLSRSEFLLRLLEQYPGDDPEAPARLRRDFGWQDTDDELRWLMGYLRVFQAVLSGGTSEVIPGRFKEGGSFPGIQQMDRHYDVRLRIHARYMPVHPHSHEFFELVILVRGTCRHMVGEDYVSMTTGDIVVVPPNTTHWLIADDDKSVIYNMHIRRSSFEQNFMNLLSQKNVLGDFFRQSLYAKEDTRSYLLIHTGDHFLGDNLLAEIDGELHKESPYQEDILNTLCKLFFLRLLEGYGDRITTARIAGDRADVTELMRTIQQSGGNVTMEELCERFNYSARQLSRLISQYTGSSLRDLRRDLRMKRAGQLLRETRLSVEEVSEACGYPNLNHFYTAFKNTYHQTPVSYRRTSDAAAPGDALRVEPAI